MVQLLAFLLLGLGIDDAFVITQNYRQVSAGLAPREKVSTALRISGTSISVTSFTDMVAPPPPKNNQQQHSTQQTNAENTQTPTSNTHTSISISIPAHPGTRHPHPHPHPQNRMSTSCVLLPHFRC